MQRRQLAAILCVAVLGTAACSPDTAQSSAPSAPPAGSGASAPAPSESADATTVDVIRLAASTQGGGYPTPYAAIRGPGRLMTTFMFDQLGFPDVTGKPRPWLAKSWESSEDGLTWTFHLNENATFTDGHPLTSDDVVFTFDYNTKGPGSTTAISQNLGYIGSVTAPDPATVVFTLKNARPSFLTDVAGAFGLSIMPRHIWESVTDPAQFQGEQAVTGSGPYILKEFDQATNSFDLVANNDFYLGKPVVQEIQIVPVGDPLLALGNGELDMAGSGNAPVPQAQFEDLSSRFKVFMAKGEYNVAMFFNLAAGFPYDDVSFRQAVAYALNRADMVERLAGGRGVPGPTGGLGPANPFLAENLPDYAFDVANAGTMLDGIGLKDANGDGTRDLPDGSPFAITLLTSQSDTEEAGLVQEYLRAAGLTVDIKAVDQATSDAADKAGDYTMAIVHYGGLSGDPSGMIARFASNAEGEFSFTRVFGYKNEEFDALAAQQAKEADRAKRAGLVAQMQAIIANDLPQLSLYVPDQLAFADTSKYNGWAYTPQCPPCGIALNKRMLWSGSAEPVPEP